MTVEKALAAGTDEWTIYSATKTVSEREVWKFAEEHPEIDITTSMHIFCVETLASEPASDFFMTFVFFSLW